MSERIVIDPITRIEGHLRVEAEIEGGTIKNAYSSGTMVRGIENIVKDRDPRDVWAFVGRVCGVCTSIHSLASVRAVENARGIVIPPNASMVRNIMQAVLYMHDHTVHFYQLHALDWVDVVSALKADPKAAALLAQQLSPWAKNTEGYFTATQQRLKKFVASGQLGIFANGIGDIRTINLRRNRTLSLPSIIWTHRNGRKRSSRYTPCSGARIRIQTIS